LQLQLNPDYSLKVLLKKADTLYGEVGIYETELTATLKAPFASQKMKTSLRVHVLMPCKNVYMPKESVLNFRKVGSEKMVAGAAYGNSNTLEKTMYVGEKEKKFLA
jgi:hypothetical protein